MCVRTQVLNDKSGEQASEFEKECTTMKMARHPGIVRMLGMCSDQQDNTMYLLMEYCCMGDLRNYLTDKTKVCKTQCASIAD